MFVRGLWFLYREYSWESVWQHQIEICYETNWRNTKKTIQIQNERISTLELQSEELSNMSMTHLQNLKQQKDK